MITTLDAPETQIEVHDIALDETPAWTTEKMLEIFDNSLATVNSLSINQKKRKLISLSYPYSSKFERRICVEKIEDNIKFTQIDSPEKLRDLISNITSWQAETAYNDYDTNQVVVVKGVLPDNYVAILGHMRLEHLPKDYLKEGKITLKMNKRKGVNYNNKKQCVYYNTRLYCRSHPLFSSVQELKATQKHSLGTPASVIKENYHCVSFKIWGGEIIKCWDVGPDMEANSVMDIMDQYVIVG
jgi:hypothetical protein